MPVSCDWDNPQQTIIRHQFEGKWTLEELRISASHAWDLMRTVSHTVDIILDLRHAQTIPTSIMSQSNRILSHRPQNGGIFVIIGGGTFVRMLTTAFEKTYAVLHRGFRVFHADTLDEAHEILYTFRVGNPGQRA